MSLLFTPHPRIFPVFAPLTPAFQRERQQTSLPELDLRPCPRFSQTGCTLFNWVQSVWLSANGSHAASGNCVGTLLRI
jgi:hypothetical protein